MAHAEQTHWWYTGMAAIAADWLERLPSRSSGLILDVGCGTGGSLRWLTQFGRPYGVDVHPVALQLAAQRGGQRLVQADVQALPFASARFSIVTAFDVLYHLNVANDGTALRELARVLLPGGWLLLRLPAHDWLRGAHDQTVHTRHRYTRNEVRTKLLAAGLRPVRVSYANALLLGPVVLWRVLQHCVAQPAASDVRMPPQWFNRALTALLHAERFCLRRFNLPVGLSVMALAQKEAR